MNKRGQVYLLAALLLSLVIFGLASRTNYVGERFFDDDFEMLSENYDRESTIFLNKQTQENLQVGVDVLGNFLEFTVEFTTYSKTQNPDFGLIYFFDVDNSLFIGNYLDQDIVVYVDSGASNATLDGCRSKIKAGTSFDGFGSYSEVERGAISLCNSTLSVPAQDYNTSVVIGDFKYVADIISGVPEVIVVSQEFKDEQRKLFLNEDFISGKKIDINAFCSNPLSQEVLDSEVCGGV